MHWIIPALAAPFINSAVNFIDKYLVTKRVGDYRAMPLYTAFFGFCGGIIFWIFAGFPAPGGSFYYAVIAGFFYSISVAIYYTMIYRRDTSDVVIFTGATPLVVLLLSFIFLKEAISLRQLLGFSLIMIAIAIISLRKKIRLKLTTRIFFLILTMVFCYGSAAVLIKASFIDDSFAATLFYEGIGLAMGGLAIYIFFASVRNAFWKNFNTTSKKTFGLIAFNETMTVLGSYLGFFAFSIGPVALVSVVGGTQAFYSILTGLVLTLFFPKTIMEDISRDNLARKIIAAGILIVGLYFIYI